MPMLTMNSGAFINGVKPEDVPDLVEELMSRIRYSIRREGELDELEELRRRVEEQRHTIEEYRLSKDEQRTENWKLSEENRKLRDRVNELLRANCPAPSLAEGEKQTIREGNLIAAIKQLRQRLEQEHDYTLGLKEAKDLCDEYKRTLVEPLVPGAVPRDDDDVRF